MSPYPHRPWVSMKTLLAAVGVAGIALVLAFFMTQAQWLSRGAAYLRKDLRENHRIIRNYERLLAECQELRFKRQKLTEKLDQEYRQPIEQSLQLISDITSDIDHLMDAHSRKFRWVQISGVISAHQGAVKAAIRLSQQLELIRWNAGRALSPARLSPGSGGNAIADLYHELGTVFTGMRWLTSPGRSVLETDIRAILLRLGTLLSTLPPATETEDSLRLSLQHLYGEIAGYETALVSMLRREIEQLWRDLSSNSELFVAQSEADLASRLPAWGFLLFILAAVIFFLHYRIIQHLRHMRRRFSDLSLPRKIPALPPSGIREIVDFEKCFVQIADNFHRELQLNSRHIKAITTIWNVLTDMGREQSDLSHRPSAALEGSLDRLMQLLGEQIPSLSLARVLRSAEAGLIPMAPDYVSASFRLSEKFALYSRSTGPLQRVGWENSLSGWIARHAAIDPWTPDSGADVYSVSVPLRQIREFGLSPTHEQGLDGSIIGIRLRSQKGEKLSAGESGLLILYFDDPLTVPGESDWMFMTIMAHQIVSVIDTAALLDISNSQRRITSQLAIARDIQARTIPPRPPVVKGLEIDAVIRMASQVGGDYYDFIHLKNGKIGIVIADVSGKDIPAALLTMVLKTTFKALRDDIVSPAEILSDVNRILIGIISESYFVTMTCGIFDPATRVIRLANAGHTPVLLRSKDGDSIIVKNIEIQGYPLGVIEAPFKEKSVSLSPGDTLLFYTDGVLDCCNEAGERFGQQRLEAYLAGSSSVNLPARRLLAILDTFRGSVDAPDDITVVSVTLQNGEADTGIPASAIG